MASIYKRDGIFQCQVLFEGRKYRKSLSTESKALAKEKAAEYETAVRQGKIEAPKGFVGRDTVAALGLKFIGWLPDKVEGSSRRQYVCNWKHVEDYEPLASCSLDKVDHTLIEEFTRHLQDKKLKIASVNGILKTLRRALRLSFQWGLLKKDPRSLVQPLKGANEREYVLSETDEQRLVKAAHDKGSILEHVIPFACDTGLRIGEICALKWADIDGDMIHVREGKTKNAKRRVPLTKRCMAMLSVLKPAAREDVPYVFTRYGGHQPLGTTTLSVQFRMLCRDLGISEDCVFHSMRHTALTRMGKVFGASPFVLQKIAGHSSIAITEKYCHTDEEQTRALVAALGK